MERSPRTKLLFLIFIILYKTAIYVYKNFFNTQELPYLKLYDHILQQSNDILAALNIFIGLFIFLYFLHDLFRDLKRGLRAIIADWVFFLFVVTVPLFFLSVHLLPTDSYQAEVIKTLFKAKRYAQLIDVLLFTPFIDTFFALHLIFGTCKPRKSLDAIVSLYAFMEYKVFCLISVLATLILTFLTCSSTDSFDTKVRIGLLNFLLCMLQEKCESVSLAIQIYITSNFLLLAWMTTDDFWRFSTLYRE